MLASFVHTLTIAGKVFICHYLPVEGRKAYTIQVLNHVLYNTQFSAECNDVGVWQITSPVTQDILLAHDRFIEPILQRLA